MLVFIINVTYGTNAVANINESQRYPFDVTPNASEHKIQPRELFDVCRHRRTLLNIYLLGFFFLYEFNNYCNILSPEEFNRRAVSFEALYALNVRHAARGSRAHTHHNSPMALCRAFHFCRRILLIIVISCSLRTRAILNGPVVRIHVSKYRNCACVSLVHQQVRNTKICAHLMSREPLFYVQPNYSSSLHIHRVLFFHSLVRSYTRSVFMLVPCSELWRRS